MGKFKAPAPPAPSTPQVNSGKVVKRVKGVSNSSGQLSLVAAFDDLCRDSLVLRGDVPETFVLTFAKGPASEWRRRWRLAETERLRLSTLLRERDKELAGKDCQIKQARKFVEEEQRTRMRAEAERDGLASQIRATVDVLLKDGASSIKNDDTLERIRTLDRTVRNGFAYSGSAFRSSDAADHLAHLKQDGYGRKKGMAAIEESAESLLDVSDLTFDESKDDLLGPGAGKKVGRRSCSMGVAGGNGGLITKTTVTVNKDGQAHAESIIETREMPINVDDLKKRVRRSRQSFDVEEAKDAKRKVANNADMINSPAVGPMMAMHQDAPMFITPRNGIQSSATPTTGPKVKRTFSNAASVPDRPHVFQKKNVVVIEKCHHCLKRVKFGKAVVKCRDCNMVFHPECKNDAPLPCVAIGIRMPTNKAGNYLADFTPIEPPMIPALLIHCIKDVEERGLDEVGIYRVPGNEADSNEILEKFMRGPGGGGGGPLQLPRLPKYEVHAVTSCIKKFLNMLKEPVIPLSLWRVFVDAAVNPDSTDAEAEMYQAVSELPRPNRDTLAYLMIHLQTVATHSEANKMDAENLSKVMGPTIVGYSSSDPMAMLSETELQKSVVRALIAIPAEYWSTFLSVEPEVVPNLQVFGRKQHTIVGSGGFRMTYGNSGVSPDYQPAFLPLAVDSATPMLPPNTGGPSRRTRSKQSLSKQFSKKHYTFQSPML